jgi:serpin B
MSKLLRLFVLVALTGCVEPAPVDPPGDVARSTLSRDTSPSAPDADLASLREGATDFALDLHRRLASEGGNVLTSPHSIQVAFGMLRPGALGATADEIDATLGWELPPERLYAAMNRLDLELAARNRAGVTIAAANQAWAQTGYPIEPAYLDTLAVSFGAGVALWPFDADPEGGRTVINGWVSERTTGNIPELLTPGLITENTRLVLVNAVHFDAAWDVAFDPADTEDRSFVREDGSTITTPLMAVALEDARWAQTEAYAAAELDYAGGELAMLLVRPAGGLAAFEGALDAAALDAIAASLETTEVVDVRMPRFAFGSDVNLVDHLSEMGMTRVFSPSEAELEGISTASELYVSAAVHSATIEVTESGTEASAATAVVVSDRSAPSRPALTLDRPFFFAIRDRATGAILFLGRVADPSA